MTASDGQHADLGKIYAAYQHWVTNDDGEADGAAEVLAAVLRYAERCRAEGGPNLAGISGSAFVLAMLAAVDDHHAQSVSGEPDSSQARRRAMQAVGDWYAHVNEEHGQAVMDTWVEAAGQSGIEHDVHEEVTYRADGSFRKVLTIDFHHDGERQQPLPDDALVPGEVVRTGLGAALRAGLAGQWWKVARRRFGQPEWLDEGTCYLRASQALAAAAQARLALRPDEVIDRYEGVTLGWKLVESLPALDESEVAGEFGEWVIGQLEPGQPLGEGTDDAEVLSVGAIGAVEPLAHGWRVLVRAANGEHRQPKRTRDAFRRTRVEAIAAVREQWAERMSAAMDKGYEIE